MVNPPPLKIKTADSNIAIHLSKLNVGKLATLTGATGDRNFTDVVILDVSYTPSNTTPDSDLPSSNPSLCSITFDYRPTHAAGLDTSTSMALTQKDHFIDEISPIGGSCSAKYIAQPIILASPANSLKVLFDANRDVTNEIDVYYKLVPPNSNAASITNSNWTLAQYNLDPDGSGNLQDFTPSPNANYSDFSSYEVNVLNLPSFIGAQIKIVLRGGNPATPPRIKNFQLITLEE